MPKDKKTCKFLLKTEEEYGQGIKQRMSQDVFAILHDVGLQNDKYNQCWKAGFYYAFERIRMIFDLKKE